MFVPDVEAFFSTEFMEKTRQIVERTIKNGKGISLIFGASGTGKTLLMQILRQSLEDESTVALVSNCQLETPKDLFLQLAHDLHLAAAGTESVELRLQLLDYARQKSTQGIVLLFDDAQHLSHAVLEELRLLTDLTSPSLFHVVLAGTMEFEEKLTFPNLEAFNQRVASRCYLEPFSGEETSRYIIRQTETLRVDSPHGESAPIFTEEAKRRIYQLTDGVPRLINQLCAAALQFAAERDSANVDGALVNDAWSSLQHIESVGDSADVAVVQEPVISPEQIEEIVDRKKKTFQLRQFNSVEFGTLTDPDADTIPEQTCLHRPLHKGEYKPPYPEDDDEYDVVADREETLPKVYQLSAGGPTPLSGVSAEVLVPPKRKIVLSSCSDQCRKFRRRRLLRNIRHRLGLFAGVIRKTEIQQADALQTVTQPLDDRLELPSTDEADMNEKILQEYGAAVLEGRPPFVRKEPHHAYQTTETAPYDVTYPDPATGVPISLRWYPENTDKTERFGVSYSEFLNREKSSGVKTESGEDVDSETKCSARSTPEYRLDESAAPVQQEISLPIVRTSLNASLNVLAEPVASSGLEEIFEESESVADSAISLAELFQVDSSVLRRIEESPEFKSLDITVQRQLESAIQRITKAAEKIEQAAEMSALAGQHITRTAEVVEAEVKSAIPAYNDLFKQWSEFQDIISAELEAARQRQFEPLKLQSFSRRQVMIERTVPAIDVEALFR